LKRFAGLAAIIAGVAIAVSPFAFSLAGNANGGRRILDRFRTTLSTQGLVQLKSTFTTVADMGDQFFGQTLPSLRRQLHESPAVFKSDLRKHYPAIATAETDVPPVIELVKPHLSGLLAIHDDFEKVDSLPFLGLAASTVPWLLLGVGVGVTALGAAALARPTRVGAVVVGIVGLGLIVVPLAVSLPYKADAAARLDDAGSFVFSPKVAPAALATSERIDRLVTEVKTVFAPQIAARVHESPARFEAHIAHRWPAVARGLAEWPSVRSGALQLNQNQVASERDFANVNKIPVRDVPWAVIGPGILMLLGAVLALARRE
jgi:hypothetical protein